VKVSRDTQRWLDELSGSIALVSLALGELRGDTSDSWRERLRSVADSVSQDRLTRVELQLLPVLATALDRNLPDHPATALALGAKRRAAAEALLAKTAALTAANALHERGLPTAPLKGLALAETYEALGWRRPMGDADLLVVAPTSWETVEDTLVNAGFLPAPGSVHARNFDLPDGRRVDVHRFISTPNAYPEATQRLMEYVSSNPTSTWKGCELPAEVHMAHAIEHAMRWNPIIPARSVSDIAAIQCMYTDLDWMSVHFLLIDWGANRNGRALLAVLANAGIIPAGAVRESAINHEEEDVLLQTWATADPRQSWIKQSVTYFGLVPRRLSRKNPDFNYGDYLRGLWSLGPTDSISAAITSRVKRRLAHGRNLPQYIHE